MAVKKRAVVIRTPARKSTIAKCDRYVCKVCGFSLLVDEDRGSLEAREILCCGEPMKEKISRIKAK
jgi:hypothetical protein